MGTTPTYGLRFPDDPMPADVPADMANLATDTDTALNNEASALRARVTALESQLASFPVADPGDLRVSCRAAPSAGWLLCDGSAVSRTTYSELYAAIGTAYGAGDGSTTFNLPDFRGRTVVGVGPHADVSARGANEGALPGNRRPRHKHTVNDPTHSHGLPSQVGGSQTQQRFQYTFDGSGQVYGYTFAAATGVSVGPQTGAEPVDSAAYLTANVFIKT